MKMKYYLFIFILLGLASCDPKIDPQPIDKFFFKVHTNVSPIKQVYALGDTIWFEAQFPVIIFDEVSKSEVKLPTPASFLSYMDVGRIEKSNFNNQQRYGILFAVNNFDFIVKKGNITKPKGSMAQDYYRTLSFISEKSNFVIKFGIRCKTKGIFALSFPDTGIYSWGDATYKGEGWMIYETNVKGEGYSLIKNLDVFNSDHILENCYVFEVK